MIFNQVRGVYFHGETLWPFALSILFLSVSHRAWGCLVAAESYGSPNETGLLFAHLYPNAPLSDTAVWRTGLQGEVRLLYRCFQVKQCSVGGEFFFFHLICLLGEVLQFF